MRQKQISTKENNFYSPSASWLCQRRPLCEQRSQKQKTDRKKWQERGIDYFKGSETFCTIGKLVAQMGLSKCFFWSNSLLSFSFVLFFLPHYKKEHWFLPWLMSVSSHHQSLSLHSGQCFPPQAVWLLWC